MEDLVKVLRPVHEHFTPETLQIQNEVLSWNHSTMEAEGVFVEVLRNSEKDHPAFIRQFVFFVTGSKFLPFETDFEIKIEFNRNQLGPDSLPEAHCCDKILVL